MLTGLREGNHQCFETLFFRYSKGVYFVALKYLKDVFEAEGVVQETFFKVWKYRAGIRNDLDFKPYLARIAKGIIFNRFKKKLNETKYVESHFSQEKHSNQTEEEIFYAETERLIIETVRQLPPKRRRIFEMSRQERMSNKEIANTLGISEKTVENQITDAIKTLRKVISDNSRIPSPGE